MLIDDARLRALWQQQQPPAHLLSSMRRAVRTQRRRLLARRLLEGMLTVLAVVVLVWPHGDQGWSSTQLLLIPYFSVYLLASWFVVLRNPAAARDAVTESVAVYTRVRQQQLRITLRDLKIASCSAVALSVYAIAAMIAILQFVDDSRDPAWRSAGGVLLGWAVIWHLATCFFVRRGRRRALREYRALGHQR